MDSRETAQENKQTEAPAQLEKFAMSPDDLASQIEIVQNVTRRTMKEGEHYGKIPGTNKFTLLQPGAEKLMLAFRLGAEFTVLSSAEDKDLISYAVRCDLFHIPTGARVSSGIGSCNSRESRYRYRWLPTDKRPNKDEAEALKAQGVGRWRKQDGKWVWLERQENDNPWDFQNTILKMAAKRAKVAATLNATAASDIFTQDLEDMEGFGLAGGLDVGAEKAAVAAEPSRQPAEAAETSSAQTGDLAAERPDPVQPSEQAGATSSDATASPARDKKPARQPAVQTVGLDALRQAVGSLSTLADLEYLWRRNAKSYEQDEEYREIRKLFIEQRRYIEETSAAKKRRGDNQGKAA